MKDIFFHIPLPFTKMAIPIHGYGFLAMLGFLAALLAARWRAKRSNVSPETVTDVCVAALFGGIVGSRIFFVVQQASYYFDTSRRDYSIFDLFKIWEGGLVFYGGLLGAIPAVLLVVHWRKARLLNVLDVMAPATALGMAFGRMACLMRGCCYGLPLKGNPWYGLVFPPDSLPYADPSGISIAPGTRLFPTQIVSAFGWFTIFVILSFYFKHRRREGEVGGLLLVLYGLHRFNIEFLRADTHLPGEISIAQWISIVVFFVGLGLIVYCRNTPAPEAAVASPPAKNATNRKPRKKGKRKK